MYLLQCHNITHYYVIIICTRLREHLGYIAETWQSQQYPEGIIARDSHSINSFIRVIYPEAVLLCTKKSCEPAYFSYSL